ncbi:hypothetical protein [Pseudohongiella spirulinae]|uniref:Lipoprotein n=1 Tax=Pseudohongiella spirulinae TaxID=1249552 RepID=A0A0S2KBG6_9GAMM|nr:hypothetical protein [Pseudohongiella spirulinae]ALO45282.1 hypothetical protein PS2015_599 [Pseudohongiella spirulinae]
MQWMLGRLSALALLTGLLSACVNHQILDQWPETVPDQRYFIEAYHQDELNQQRQSDVEYLNWVVRFYQGSELMVTGWNDITPAVLLDLEGDVLQQAQQKSHRLGLLISAEWAKDNDVRDIDSAMLSLWGSIMVAVQEPEMRLAAMDLISNDVEALLSNQLHASDISEQRYINRLGLDPDF